MIPLRRPACMKRSRSGLRMTTGRWRERLKRRTRCGMGRQPSRWRRVSDERRTPNVFSKPTPTLTLLT